MLPLNTNNHKERSSIFGLHGLYDIIEGRRKIFVPSKMDIVNSSNINVDSLADRKAFIETIKEDYNSKPVIITRKRIKKEYIQALLNRKQYQL